MSNVYLGTVSLPNVLNWEEEEVSSIPVKRVVRKTSPTTQAEYFTREPRKITLTTRLSRTEKDSLRDLKNEFSWQPLCDYDCTPPCNSANPAFVDYVWIEKIGTRWAPEFKGSGTPWLYSVYLICSQT